MKRSYVICHMMGSVDGRIQSERWALTSKANQQYEAVHALHRADAWMCGRQTFQVDFLEQPRPAAFPRKAKVPPGDFLPVPSPFPKRSHPVHAVAVDARGKLRWESNELRGDRLVVLTTAQAPAGYLADLRGKSIPYLLCGQAEIAFGPALERLHREFGIKKLMLEGGGGINGALLAAGLIDELSLLVSPFADGSIGTPTVFDVPGKKAAKKATPLRLIATKPRPGGLVWLRYRVLR